METSSQNAKTKNGKRYEYKDEDIFVIEDESNFTMENNNMPNAKADAMEIGKGKIEMARKQLSSPSAPFELRDDLEDKQDFRLDSSNMSVKPGEALDLDTERDAI